ncbi:hypothetical protein X766_33205 [Mesorhizobium sp. LSJC255A00]|nr:hypothetical protein X766_33205 [Mesorhizobium sp. LSJC255A00]
MFEIAERERIDFDHVRRGILHVYWDKPGFDHGRKVNQLLIEGGLDRRPVTAGEIASIEPALQGAFYGGFYTPSDSTGDIRKYTTGLARACERRGGGFHYDGLVTRIERRGRFRVTWAEPWLTRVAWYACRSNTPACIPTASLGPCSVE